MERWHWYRGGWGRLVRSARLYRPRVRLPLGVRLVPSATSPILLRRGILSDSGGECLVAGTPRYGHATRESWGKHGHGVGEDTSWSVTRKSRGKSVPSYHVTNAFFSIFSRVMTAHSRLWVNFSPFSEFEFEFEQDSSTNVKETPNNYLDGWIIRIVNYETQLSWSSPIRSFKILSQVKHFAPIDSKASRREKKRNQVPPPQFISSYTYTHVHLHAYIVRFNSLIQGIGSVTRTPVSRRPSAL